MRRGSGLILFLSTLLVGLAAPAYAKRVALVIGNSEYKHATRLENPKNDANDLAAALTKLGFAVTQGRDLDKLGMDRTVQAFTESLAGADVGLFFYAGHGLQIGGQNYLVPTDAKLAKASAVDFELVRLDLVQRTLEREASTNIIIIDACRDNPLARNLARALGTRSVEVGRGLAAIESAAGTLIGFSTQPGNVALDGAGRNSPYAAALLKHIAVPGDDLPTILINVRNDVMAATARRQVPWEHSAMTAKFYFIPPAPANPTRQQLELMFWQSVKDSTNPTVLKTYLERYPNGQFAPIARTLIEQLTRQQEALKTMPKPDEVEGPIGRRRPGPTDADERQRLLEGVAGTWGEWPGGCAKSVTYRIERGKDGIDRIIASVRRGPTSVHKVLAAENGAILLRDERSNREWTLKKWGHELGQSGTRVRNGKWTRFAGEWHGQGQLLEACPGEPAPKG